MCIIFIWKKLIVIKKWGRRRRRRRRSWKIEYVCKILDQDMYACTVNLTILWKFSNSFIFSLTHKKRKTRDKKKREKNTELKMRKNVVPKLGSLSSYHLLKRWWSMNRALNVTLNLLINSWDVKKITINKISVMRFLHTHTQRRNPNNHRRWWYGAFSKVSLHCCVSHRITTTITIASATTTNHYVKFCA